MDDTGLQNAAILLMSLGEEEAAQVFKHLSPNEVQGLGEAIRKLKSVSPDRIDTVLRQFNAIAGHPSEPGGNTASIERPKSTDPVSAGAPPAPNPPEPGALPLGAARQAGYQDGYRDGLVALDNVKQAYAAQATAQIATLLEALDAQLDGLQQAMARVLAVTATQLARQIVRGELQTRPELITHVADEAVEALLASARHLTLRVHPDDHALMAAGAADLLEVRGSRLVGDPAIRRGGVLIDSDIGAVDATVETRWLQATAPVGSGTP